MLAPILIALVAMQQSAPPKVWYGPQEVTFNIQYAGNPYDPAANDVKVRFTDDHGFSLERLAYFSHGSWKAVLVSPQQGKFKAVLVRNGHDSTEEAVPPVIELTQKLSHGFIHRDPINVNRFAYDDGTSFFPIGFNLGWQSRNLVSMSSQISKMGAAGVSWTRIWSDDWDDKDPWWPRDDPFAIKDQLWPKALDHLASEFSACADSNLNFQFVLFNHGPWSSSVDPEWQNNPWNASKGGFLKSAADFFTNPEAKRRTKMWLRYAVARWGGNPNLFAWELFNEVQNTDAAKAGKWADIESWHKEMADYIRSLDPYNHLITTSSDMDHANLWLAMDFYQPHEYSDNLPLMLDSYQQIAEKPLFVGEFGPTTESTKERPFVRNVIWSSIRANRAAAAMYWYWDRVEKDDMYPEFTIWSKVLARSEFGSHPSAASVAVSSSVGRADGVRDTGWLLVRIRGAMGKNPKISFQGLTAGTWNVTWFNLDTGEEFNDLAATHGESLQFSTVKGNDMVALLRLG